MFFQTCREEAALLATQVYVNEEEHTEGTEIKSPLSFLHWRCSKGAQSKSSPRQICPLFGRMFPFPSDINRQHNTDRKNCYGLAIRKDPFFNVSIGYKGLTCSGAMYEGVPLYTVLSTGTVASSASTVTRPKSPIFTSLFLLNMMFSGCSGQKGSSISLRPGATSQGLVVSTSPSDLCG